MIVKHDFSLKKYNTFGIAALAETFVAVQSEEELVDFILHSAHRKNLQLVLGGGSNMLLTQNVAGTVLHINIKGKKVVEETTDYVIIAAGAGENWHEIVLWALAQNLGGIENLSLIPGNIGTAPVQNIGAYGVELKDTFYSLDAINLHTGQAKTFSRADCQFGYRESIFKQAEKGNFIITNVRLKLAKPPHTLATHYGAIGEQLLAHGVKNPTIQDVSQAVIAIRQSKLPDPKEIGNSGSFFKNPIVAIAFADELKTLHPDLPVYPLTQNTAKLAAGWLIEKAGWKGYRRGDAGVHAKQALVLVNYGNATGPEIYALSLEIIADVQAKFGVLLEAEVNLI